jgi:hypothetical protein
MKWTPAVKAKYGFGHTLIASFLINDEGLCVARVREPLYNGGYTVVRIYKPAVRLSDAIDSSSNYTTRTYEIGTIDEIKSRVEAKFNTGVVNTMKNPTRKTTSKTVKSKTRIQTNDGPAGTMRYRNIKTGRFVTA